MTYLKNGARLQGTSYFSLIAFVAAFTYPFEAHGQNSLYQKGWQAYLRRDYSQAERCWRESASDDRCRNKEILDAILNLARNRMAHGKIENARSLCLFVLDSRIKFLGNENSETAAALRCLGDLSQLECKRQEAEAYYQRAFEIQQRYGNKGPEYVSTAASLARLYSDDSQFDKGNKYYNYALEEVRKTLKAIEKRGSTLKTSDFIVIEAAAFLMVQKRYSDAASLYADSLNYRKKVFGESDVLTFAAKENLADAYVGQGKFEEAETLYQSILKFCLENNLDSQKGFTVENRHGLIFERSPSAKRVEEKLSMLPAKTPH